MIANELRIGNLVIYGGSVVKMNLHEFTHFLRFPETYTPIILTEEILLKCGFKRFPWGLVINELLFKDDLKCSFLELEIGNGFRVKVNFLHQLQNLYFALTGKELEIEL